MEKSLEPTSITEIICYPQFIRDSLIKNMSLVPGTMWCGGYAVVYQFVSISGEKWAFRCQCKLIKGLANRMRAISDSLRKAKLPYFCDFEFLEWGITAEGEHIPTSRMKWINGKRLSYFIYDSIDNPVILSNLAKNFLTMCKEMNKYQIAHGDLQHENILVGKNASVYLIDYDSVYVPTLKGYSDIIAGKPNYQHPKRYSNAYASEKLDYFSELVIYLSLIAFAARPNLIREFDIIQKEQLLFCKDDYASVHAFKNSKGYKETMAIGGECSQLVAVLEKYIKCDSISELEPFWTYNMPSRKIVLTTDVCGKCGKSYYAEEDLFCIYCGTKRKK